MEGEEETTKYAKGAKREAKSLFLRTVTEQGDRL